MKIYLKLPGGTEFSLEREPMSQDRLVAVCITICVVVGLAGFFGVFIFG